MLSNRLAALSAMLSVKLTLALSAIAPATAQLMPPQAMLNSLGANCNRITEVTYQSQIIASPNRNMLVRSQGTLRKTVNPNSQLRAIDTANYCYPDTRETLSRQITIETTSGPRQLIDAPYSEGYIVYQPLAFSADSRFLALDMRVAYTDGSTGSYALFLDTEDDSIVRSPTLCDGLTLQNHLGFTSETEAVVLCQDELRATERNESVNLLTGAVSQLAVEPQNIFGYGDIIRSFEVINIQLRDQ